VFEDEEVCVAVDFEEADITGDVRGVQTFDVVKEDDIVMG